MPPTHTASHAAPAAPNPALTSLPRVDGRRRQVCTALLLAAAAPRGWAQDAPAAPTGYGTLDLDWTDGARNRPVPARLYWPHAASLQAPLPLVVFSHGIGGSRGNYSYLGRHWAAQGVASLHVQHVGSDRSVWAGNPFAVVSRLRAAAQDHEAIDRVRDVRFALDQVLHAGELAPGVRIDPARIVAAGHSYGANTTLLAIGARVQRGGQWLEFHEPRFSAAVIISAPPFYGESDLRAILGAVAVPTLHVTATEDVIQIPGLHSGVADRIAVYDAVADPRKALVVFQGGSHSIFTDRAGTGGFSLNPQVKAATSELALAFLQRTFEGDATGLQRWGRAWRPIVARVAGAMEASPLISSEAVLQG
jgi:predicted dienelactone hydrolase